MIAMFQMRFQRILADGDGMHIVRISRWYVADIHFGILRYCTWRIKCRHSDTTMNEKK